VAQVDVPEALADWAVDLAVNVAAAVLVVLATQVAVPVDLVAHGVDAVVVVDSVVDWAALEGLGAVVRVLPNISTHQSL
jgi:hypothetical protein